VVLQHACTSIIPRANAQLETKAYLVVEETWSISSSPSSSPTRRSDEEEREDAFIIVPGLGQDPPFNQAVHEIAFAFDLDLQKHNPIILPRQCS
jgi:hypothetical protein